MYSRNTSSITPSATFSQTLQFITKLKLHELQKQKEAHATHAKVPVPADDETKQDLVGRLETVLAAARAWSGSGSVEEKGDVAGRLNLRNLDLWIKQAKADPSFSVEVLRGWTNVLEAHIQHIGTRFEYASLFGTLFNEWVQNEGVSAADEAGHSLALNTDTTAIGRKEMHEQKEKLLSLIFQEKTVDIPALTHYLDGLFAVDEAAEGLKKIRKSNEKFCKELARETISVGDLPWIIHSVLSADLLESEKSSTLREFLNNPVVLKEVASVLNMRLAGFASWSWPTEGVTVDMRRHLNGKYRAFMDPEIVDALFVEFVGKKFQVQLKSVLRTFMQSDAWKPSLPPIERSVLLKRMAQLGEQATGGGVEDFRRDERLSRYFLNQLPDTVYTSPNYDYNGEGDSKEVKGTFTVHDTTGKLSATGKFVAYDHSGTVSNSFPHPMNIKQSLLHNMVADVYLNQVLHGKHTVVRTDFEWFGPSLSHDAVVEVLRYLGVRSEWLDFTRRFLATPVRFRDDLMGEVRVRKCGTPISYALSSLCGEVMMFAMDFAVNQRADGLFLYRIHDDLWLWDSQSERCVKAWKEMQVFADIAGLNFNMSKTGTACVGGEGIDSALPEGDIRWGFLRFDSPLGRFTIDQKQVDEHITELRRQLAATKSIFGWINAYNKYLAFFTRNFGGTPAFCFGPAHADDMINTHARIQRALFPDHGGVIGRLSGMIQERFGITDIPHGYFLFPIGSGGLEVLNPLIELFAVRKLLKDQPEKFFQKQIKEDKTAYNALKKLWDERAPTQWSMEYAKTQFMSFEEYIAHREMCLASWSTTLQSLLKTPDPIHVTPTPALDAILKAAQAADIGGDEWLARRWEMMGYYQKWVLAMHAEEMIKKFGSLAIVDPALIPVGMVQLFKSSRMRWEQ